MEYLVLFMAEGGGDKEVEKVKLKDRALSFMSVTGWSLALIAGIYFSSQYAFRHIQLQGQPQEPVELSLNQENQIKHIKYDIIQTNTKIKALDDYKKQLSEVNRLLGQVGNFDLALNLRLLGGFLVNMIGVILLLLYHEDLKNNRSNKQKFTLGRVLTALLVTAFIINTISEFQRTNNYLEAQSETPKDIIPKINTKISDLNAEKMKLIGKKLKLASELKTLPDVDKIKPIAYLEEFDPDSYREYFDGFAKRNISKSAPSLPRLRFVFFDLANKNSDQLIAKNQHLDEALWNYPKAIFVCVTLVLIFKPKKPHDDLIP